MEVQRYQNKNEWGVIDDTANLWYNGSMYNWSTDTTELKKDPERCAIWELEQLINFGLNGSLLDAEKLRTYWPRLALDPARKAYLSFLLNLHG